jgi:hypothetical protein
MPSQSDEVPSYGNSNLAKPEDRLSPKFVDLDSLMARHKPDDGTLGVRVVADATGLALLAIAGPGVGVLAGAVFVTSAFAQTALFENDMAKMLQDHGYQMAILPPGVEATAEGLSTFLSVGKLAHDLGKYAATGHLHVEKIGDIIHLPADVGLFAASLNEALGHHEGHPALDVGPDHTHSGAAAGDGTAQALAGANYSTHDGHEIRVQPDGTNAPAADHHQAHDGGGINALDPGNHYNHGNDGANGLDVGHHQAHDGGLNALDPGSHHDHGNDGANALLADHHDAHVHDGGGANALDSESDHNHGNDAANLPEADHHQTHGGGINALDPGGHQNHSNDGTNAPDAGHQHAHDGGGIDALDPGNHQNHGNDGVSAPDTDRPPAHDGGSVNALDPGNHQSHGNEGANALDPGNHQSNENESLNPSHHLSPNVDGAHSSESTHQQVHVDVDAAMTGDGHG